MKNTNIYYHALTITPTLQASNCRQVLPFLIQQTEHHQVSTTVIFVHGALYCLLQRLWSECCFCRSVGHSLARYDLISNFKVSWTVSCIVVLTAACEKMSVAHSYRIEIPPEAWSLQLEKLSSESSNQQLLTRNRTNQVTRNNTH